MTRTGSRRGFTLVETILAATLGSMVLLGTVSVFTLAARSERTLAARFDQTEQMARMQVTLRRSMLTLVMKENATGVQDDASVSTGLQELLEPVERPRILLVPDEIVNSMIELGRTGPTGAASVQRLEVVLSAPPLPNALLGPAAGWASPVSIDALDFSLADLEGENTGGLRGVFELRPDGQRERLMRSVGLDREDWPVPDAASQIDGWTLWWRPMTLEEIDHLNAGGEWLTDEVLTEAGQRRLAGAAPLLRGITELRWQFYDDRQMLESYAGLEMNDLPAYVTLELRTASGLYANWMLEMGWTVGADPNAEEDEDNADGGGAEDDSGGADDTGGVQRRSSARRGGVEAGRTVRGGRTDERVPPRDTESRSGGKFIHWETGGGQRDGGG